MLERRPGKVSARFKRDVGRPVPNLLTNGDFNVAQRGAGPHTNAAASPTNVVNNDDAYILDQWVFLAEGSDTCDVSQSTSSLPSGGVSAIALDVETGNRKFGIAQFLELNDTVGLRGQTVSLSFKAVVSGASISSIRAAVMAWDGTADTVTSDVVSAWAVAGTNPTLVANWTYENTPASMTLTTSWQQFVVEGVVLDTASTNNIGVFIWIDDTTVTVGDFLRITDVRLEIAPAATDYVRRRYAEELALCERYFYSVRATVAQTYPFAAGVAHSTTLATVMMPLPVAMRRIPTSTFSAVAPFDLIGGSITHTVTAIADGGVGTLAMAQIEVTVGAAGLSDGGFYYLRFDTSATGFIDVSAEL